MSWMRTSGESMASYCHARRECAMLGLEPAVGSQRALRAITGLKLVALAVRRPELRPGERLAVDEVLRRLVLVLGLDDLFDFLRLVVVLEVDLDRAPGEEGGL